MIVEVWMFHVVRISLTCVHADPEPKKSVLSKQSFHTCFELRTTSAN